MIQRHQMTESESEKTKIIFTLVLSLSMHLASQLLERHYRPGNIRRLCSRDRHRDHPVGIAHCKCFINLLLSFQINSKDENQASKQFHILWKSNTFFSFSFLFSSFLYVCIYLFIQFPLYFFSLYHFTFVESSQFSFLHSCFEFICLLRFTSDII